MIFDFIKFSDQAERPDLRLWLSLSLMIIGCLFLNIFKTPSQYISDELAKIESQTGRVTTSDLKDLIIDDPDTIKNLTQDEIGKLFGLPSFIRQEGDVLIWQYKSSACVYEIFWDIKHEQYNILHTNFRPFEPIMTMSSCLKDLL
jgi:hypothetical protein